VREHASSGNAGVVEIVAHKKGVGRAGRQHEISRFDREGGAWLYVDGATPADAPD
jgi:SEC-C motif-containing protein